MKTTVTHPDGTRGQYVCRPELLDRVMAKHPKPRRLAERRVYPPKVRPGGAAWTTRAYVEAFFLMNGDQPSMRYGSNKIHAYSPRFLDHMKLYEQLGTNPQDWPVNDGAECTDQSLETFADSPTTKS